MNNVLRLAIADPNDETRESLKTMLVGMELVWLDAECSRYEFFVDVVGQTHPDVAVVSLDHDCERGLELIAQLHQAAPECSVLVVSSSSDGALILRSMRAGAKEFLTHPVRIEDMLGSLERIGHQRFGQGDSQTRGSTAIAVCGAAGGVGSTSLAVNLGCVLARDTQNSVALIDLDLTLGDADVFLDTIPEYTLVDVAENISRLDFSLLKRSLTKHSSGLYLLPRPVHLHDASLIKADDFQRVVGLLKATFSHVIFDLSKGFGPLDMEALKSADHSLIVIQLDLPCLRNVVRLLTSFDDIENVKPTIRIIVNRSGLDNGQISLKKAQETIGREIFWQVPNNYRVMVEVRNNGVPLVDQAPRAAITQSITMLADALSGGYSPGDDTKSGLGRWLSFWPKKGKGREKTDEPAKV